MSEFPRAHSERALTTERPQALRDDADIRNEAAGKAKVAGAAVESLSKSVTDWNGVVEKVQTDTALYNYKTGLQDISNNAAMDTDINSERKYQKQVLDLKKNVLKGVSSEQVKNRMGAELNYMEKVGSIDIQTAFRKKTVAHGQSVALSNLELLSQTPGSEKAIEAAIKDAVQTGYFDEVEGFKQEKLYKAKMRENWFLQEVNENPADAKKRLIDNAYGFTISEKDDAWKVYDRELRTIQDQSEKEFMQMKLDGTLKEDAIRAAIKKEKIAPETGIAMIKDLNTVVQPKATELDKVAAFNKLVAMRDALKDKDPWFWTSSTFQERSKYRAEVFKAHSNGFIDDDQLSNDFLTEEISDKFMADKVFQNAMKQVNSLSENYQSREDKDIAKAMMSKDLTRKIMDGLTPDEALRAVSAERIQADFPDVKAEDLLFTAKKYGKPVWQVYKLIRKQK